MKEGVAGSEGRGTETFERMRECRKRREGREGRESRVVLG